MYTSLRSCVPPDGKLICFIRVIMLIYSLVNRLHVISLILCFRGTIASVTRDHLFHLCHRVDLTHQQLTRDYTVICCLSHNFYQSFLFVDGDNSRELSRPCA